MSSKRLTGPNVFILSVILFFSAGFIIYPIYSLVKESLGVAADSNSFLDVTSGSVFNSVLLSLVTVAGSALIGISLAYFFQFRNFAFKNILFTLLLIPIATPPLVGVVSFLFLLNENGLITKIITLIFNLQSAPFSFDGWFAIITVHVYSFYPFFLLFVSSALMKLDANVIEASHSLGASRSRTFIRVIFPQLIPSVIGASLIVFMASMASFSAPFIFGGSTRFLTTEIYSAKINGDIPLASALSILLTVFSLLFLLLIGYYRRRIAFVSKTKGTAKSISLTHQKSAGFAGVTVILLFVILILLPAMALLFLSLIPEGSLMRNYFTESISLVNYSKIFGESQFFEPFSNSLKMSFLAVLVTIVIGVGASFLITRKKLAGGNFLESILSLPYGIPGTVIALSFIISFNVPTIFTAFIPIVGTFWILPLAYAVRNLPVVTQSSVAGFNAIDPTLEEASSTLGAKGSFTFRKVVLPLVSPSIMHGAMLVFINSLGEFVSTILLYTYSTKTISVEIYSQLRLYNTGAAAAYGVILFLMVMVIVYLSRRTLDKALAVG